MGHPFIAILMMSACLRIQIPKQPLLSSKRLVVFVTINSKDSKWVPWELGIGDSCLAPDNVALLPTASTGGDQEGDCPVIVETQMVSFH
jgi:hypothetical protein